ncbi:MAG: dienelactone hydrolase family protein [Chitinophagaceae bacterium]|nr:dienelactone hydrolase family protein [Chitinophagaceae bacterium]
MKKITVLPFLFLCCAVVVRAQSDQFLYSKMPDVFPGSRQLTLEGDLSVIMLDGAHKFIERKIDESINARQQLWKRDLSSADAYEKSVEPNRTHFTKYIGVVDKSEPPVSYNVGFPEKYPAPSMQKFADGDDDILVAETSRYRIYQVRWPVFNRVNGEGLLIEPKSKPVATVVAIPDADQQPEQLIGLSKGVAPGSQFARHLAENGYQVLIPVIISRDTVFAGEDKQQTYREWLYRQSFQMGRHIIGYEVQKIMSAIDWFKKNDKNLKIGVAGYNEGGLLAFYTAAADKRVDAVLVSGYFNSRQKVWDEPVYRNVWALLTEFGDAEIASLIAPRALTIEHSAVQTLVDQLEPSLQKKMQVEGLPYTGYKGKIQTPSFASMQSEFNRIDGFVKQNFQQRQLISGKNGQAVKFGSKEALQAFTKSLGNIRAIAISNEIPNDKRKNYDPHARQLRQVREIEDDIQQLVRDSDRERDRFFLHKIMPEIPRRNWSTQPYHQYFPVSKFTDKSDEYRKYFAEEILGRFHDELLPFNPQTRKVYDRERWTGYEVVLDVFPDVMATGILLIPKNIKSGEHRPVVVCQHGRNDYPRKLIEGNVTTYNDVAAKLADQGFVVYVPQNPYRGEDRYRWLARKGNNVKKTLFSFITSQHEQTIKWLGSLAFVDKNRIAYYGLSYGGQTAMRVPPILEGYCLSICAGDFGDWTKKVTDTHYKGSFMNTLEWEMPYFNMGNTFSYAEMAYLIFPRPFMVERGHHDLIQPDAWVGYEFGKIRFFYDQFNLGDKAEIEYFNGGHSMRGEGTFRFLHKHLNWP